MTIMASVGELLMDKLENIEEQFKKLMETCEDIVDFTEIYTDEEDELDGDEIIEENYGLEDNMDAPNVNMGHKIEVIKATIMSPQLWVITVFCWCTLVFCKTICVDPKLCSWPDYYKGLSFSPYSIEINPITLIFCFQFFIFTILFLCSLKRKVIFVNNRHQ